jgi:hypothetical protein
VVKNRIDFLIFVSGSVYSIDGSGFAGVDIFVNTNRIGGLGGFPANRRDEVFFSGTLVMENQEPHHTYTILIGPRPGSVFNSRNISDVMVIEFIR